MSAAQLPAALAQLIRDVAIKVLHPDLGAALGGERFLSEMITDVTPSVSTLGSAASFDVTADGHVIVVERVPGTFDLVLVRNGIASLDKPASK